MMSPTYLEMMLYFYSQATLAFLQSESCSADYKEIVHYLRKGGLHFKEDQQWQIKHGFGDEHGRYYLNLTLWHP